MSKASLRTQLIFIASAFVTLIWLSAIVIVAFNLKWFLDRLIDIELERDMRLSQHLYQIIAPNLDPDLKGLEALHNDVGIISSLQGEWGFSFASRMDVDQLILQRLPTTLIVIGMSQLLALAIALPVGIYAATRPYSIFDQIASTLALHAADSEPS